VPRKGSELPRGPVDLRWHPRQGSNRRLVRNTLANRRFVEMWLDACTDARVLTDAPNTCGQPNLPGFVEHRHDQSVLSVLFWRERDRLPHRTCPPAVKPGYLRHHRRLQERVPIVVWNRLPQAVQYALVLGGGASLRRGLTLQRARLGGRPAPAALPPWQADLGRRGGGDLPGAAGRRSDGINGGPGRS
jgi:hypothetical protein